MESLVQQNPTGRPISAMQSLVDELVEETEIVNAPYVRQGDTWLKRVSTSWEPRESYQYPGNESLEYDMPRPTSLRGGTAAIDEELQYLREIGAQPSRSAPVANIDNKTVTQVNPIEQPSPDEFLIDNQRKLTCQLYI